MRHEGSVISEAGTEGWSRSVQFYAMVFNKVIKHFDGILFWKANVIRMTAMIKLRHQGARHILQSGRVRQVVKQTRIRIFAGDTDSTLLLSSIEVHQQRLGRIPRMVAADAGFYSRANEKAGQALGVRWMSVPNKNTTSKERKLLQHQRWFRRGQKWRTGSEGRISVLKRRHGLRRCLYPGLDGMRRWVGLGVIADNIIQMGCYLARQRT